MKRYWLIKSEPGSYSIDALAQEPGQRAMWDGVRNYQARNYMWKEMRLGDGVLFYHSACKEPGVAGLARVASEPYPDPTQFDAASKYFDPKASEPAPRWWLVDIELVEKFATFVPLSVLRETPKLATLDLLRRGNRLSIQPVTKAEYDHIRTMGRKKPR